MWNLLHGHPVPGGPAPYYGRNDSHSPQLGSDRHTSGTLPATTDIGSVDNDIPLAPALTETVLLLMGSGLGAAEALSALQNRGK